jgi:hypothetical protein
VNRHETQPVEGEQLPVVYEDHLPQSPILALGSLAIASTESQQARSYALVIDAFATMYNRLPAEQQRLVEDAVVRIVSVLGDLVLTNQLEQALFQLISSLESANRSETAGVVRQALHQAQGNLRH